jgi:UDP-N-acetylglucosamine 1-carboxyvinyltransferase
MDKLIIKGGNTIGGVFTPSGSKNSALPIIFASIASSERITLKNTPYLADISTARQVLRSLGGKDFQTTDSLIFDNSELQHTEVDYNLVKTMRASILTLGPLLARFGKAKVSLPGGCAIGARPVNLHLDAFKQLGATIEVRNGYIYAQTAKLKGCEIRFPKESVTATENIMIAATLADGVTTIHNAAKEPEISDLANFLNTIGAKISGIGTSTLHIEGVTKLGGGEYFVCYDRIEAGTYLIAAAITGGKLTINKFNKQSSQAVLDALTQAGCNIIYNTDSITLDATNNPLNAVDITTGVFPEFPTDMQAQFSVLNAIANGKGSITETIFENRFMHIPELSRMGADFQIDGNTITSYGVTQLTGASLMATDLRASASLVLAGLVAQGETVIDRVYHLDRGYENIEEKLGKLGANIKRINI